MNRRRRLAFLALLLAAVPLVWTAPVSAAPGCGMNDLDGDGTADVVIGSPGATVAGQAGAGLVQVLTTTAQGGVLARTITAPVPHAGDHFGAAVGDVMLGTRVDDTSPCSSLVVGSPGFDANGEADAGAVFVFRTLDDDPVRLDQDFDDESPGVQAGAHFGAAISQQSVGVGGARPPVFYASAPDFDLGVHTDAGIVHRIAMDDGVAEQTDITGDSGFLGSSEVGDHFGAAISGTPYPDELVIGSPGESIDSARGAGQVWFWTPTARQVVTQDTPGVPGSAESGDGFGASVFVGSEVAEAARRGGHPVPIQIFAGAPTEDLTGHADAGGVVQFGYTPPGGTTRRILTKGSVFWSQDSTGVAGAAERGDRFGSSVESLDLGADGKPTFVVGAPGEDLGSVADAGGLATLGGGVWIDQGTAGVPGDSERGDRFGARLGSRRSLDAGPASWREGLVVGAPGEDAGTGTVLVGLPVVGSGTLLSGSGPRAAYGAALAATR